VVLRREDVAFTVLQIYGMCNHSWTWYTPDGPLSAEEIGRRFTRTLMVGLGTPETQADPEQVDEQAIVALLDEAAQMIEEAPRSPSCSSRSAAKKPELSAARGR